MVLYIKIQGVDPDDLDVDPSRKPSNDQATELSNDIFRLLNEHHNLDPDGVATVVNPDEHERLQNADLDASSE